MANQYRDYCLTLNNPKQSDEEFLEYIKSLPHIKYAVFQREIGKKKQTPHFQIYIEFTLGKRFDTMKGYFPTAHIESRQAKIKAKARDYCMKESGEDKDKDFVSRVSGPYEFGTFAEERERTDWNDIIEMIQAGAALKEIKEAYPSQYFRYYKNIEHLFHEHMAEKYCEIDRNIKVVYIWGPPRIGKSRSLDKLYSRREYFRVNKYKNPFDKYSYQPVLVLDEYDSQIDITYLNNLLDSLPCQLECRYDDKWAAWDTVYIISNLPFEKQYLYEKAEKKEALKSRISEFINFTGSPKKVTVAELVPLDNDGDLPF